MKAGDRVMVMETAPYYGGKVGYVRGFGSSPAALNSVIVAEIPGKKTTPGRYAANDFMFVVEREHLVPAP